MYKLLILVLFMVGFGDPLFAKDIKAKILLNSIEAKRTTDKSGDEVYFDITEYASSGRSGNYRLPEKPEHWLSKQLPQVKNLNLWEKTLKDNEEYKVIITVMEQESFENDELIGAAEVILKNNHGKIEKKWTIPQFKDAVPEEMAAGNKSQAEPRVFELKGNNSDYKVAISVIQE